MPGLYFLHVLSKEEAIIDKAQSEFNKGLNEYILGEDYLNQSCTVDYLPLGFIRGLPFVSGLFKEGRQDLWKYGQSLRIRITRTFTRIKDGKEEKVDETTYEQGNLFVLPKSSFVKSKQAFFFFNIDKFDLLEAIGIQLNDKRHFNLTDIELEKWFSVSVGGLGDLFRDNYDEKHLWTKAITPYFESVLKALVVKYGQLNLLIQDGYFFIFTPKKETPYKSTQYGNLDKRQFNSNWGSNKETELKGGQCSPKKAIPYLYKIYLNKIMHAMTNYFLMDHALLSPAEIEASQEVLEYVINQYNNLDIDEMQREYKEKY